MFLLIVILLITLILYYYFSMKRRLNILSEIPGPKGLPIFGNFFQFVTKDLEEIIDITSELAIKYGGLYKIYAFNRIILVATNPNDIQDILSSSKHIEKNYLYELLRTWLGEGLLLSGGLKWHNRRKIITPTFHFKILEEFLYIFNQQSEILIEKLQNYCIDDDNDMKSFDIHNLIALATLDVIAETAMGIQINAQIDSSCEYVNAILEIAEIIAHRFIRIWLRNDFLCFIFGNSLWRRQQNALKILHSFTEKIIVERRNLLLNKENEIKIEEIGKNDVDDNFGQKKRMAFLDVLLQSHINGKPLSNTDIREEVDTFMFEGHDTTTSAICFTLILLSRHSTVQEKVFNEIVQIIGSDRKKLVTYQDLQDLKYLELVIKESLRMYPPVAVIGRKIEEDTVINSKSIPANTQFLIYLQGLMRNPNFFKDPNTFIPERHTNSSEYDNEDNKEFNPYAYIPFSAGPRNCIGQKFAMLEMKSIISKILRNFELLPYGDDVKPLMDIILRSKTGFNLGIRTRKY